MSREREILSDIVDGIEYAYTFKVEYEKEHVELTIYDEPEIYRVEIYITKIERVAGEELV